MVRGAIRDNGFISWHGGNQSLRCVFDLATQRGIQNCQGCAYGLKRTAYAEFEWGYYALLAHLDPPRSSMPQSMGLQATDWGSSLEAQSYYGAE